MIRTRTLLSLLVICTVVAPAAAPRRAAALSLTMSVYPLIDGGRVYAVVNCYVSGSVTLHGLDPATGKERWSFVPPGASPVAAAEGGFYVGDADGSAVALDPESGDELWSAPAITGAGVDGLLVADDLLYATGRYGALSALEAATGEVRWRIAVAALDRIGIQVAGTTLFAFELDGGVLVALDRETGQERWRFAQPGSWLVPPAIVGPDVYVAGNVLGNLDSGTLFKLDLATGAERWRYEAGSPIQTPTVVDGTAFASGVEGTLYAVDAVSGQERWRFPTDFIWIAAPPVVDGLVYLAGGTGGVVHAVDAATGEERWQLRTGAETYHTPLVVDGVVYIATQRMWEAEDLYALDAATGDERWRGGPEGIWLAGPLLGEGHLIYSVTFEVVALDAATGTPLWNWPAPTPPGC